MQMFLKLTNGAAFLLLLTIINRPSTLHAQGSLTPPGAPAPTMKSLDQIEARTPVDATHTPGDANNQFIIGQPGSYYLTGNIIGAPGQNGILIQTNNVTLDLNGFYLNGNGNASGNGILAASLTNTSLRGITIRNGTVEYWGTNGIACSLAINNLVEKIRANNNGYGIGCGIIVGSDSTVANCICEANGTGIFMLSGTVSDCVADENSGNGITADPFCNIIGCAANDNFGTGISTAGYCIIKNCNASLNFSNGITLGRAAQALNCSASLNSGSGITFTPGITNDDLCTVSGCTANENHVAGILVNSGCQILDNIASGNTGDGVQFIGKCQVTHNTASNNGGNGFHVTGTGVNAVNRIDSNTAIGNTGDGIFWANDFVVRNTCLLNGVNYSPSVGTGNTGPVQAASSATNPWANF